MKKLIKYSTIYLLLLFSLLLFYSQTESAHSQQPVPSQEASQTNRQATPRRFIETPPKFFTVVMSDFQAPGTRRTDTFGTLVRDAVADRLKQAGNSYRVIERAEMPDAAKALGLRLPAFPLQPAEFQDAEWLRLARELNSDALVSGEVRSFQDRKKGTRVKVSFLFRDVKEGETINGGSAELTVEPRARETDDAALRRTAVSAAQDAVQEMLRRPTVVTTVLQVRGDIILVGGGRREGLNPGDELNVYRYTTNGYTRSGRIRITHTDETQADARVITNQGIAPEDVARKAYLPNARKP